jgi:hypothetical protein
VVTLGFAAQDLPNDRRGSKKGRQALRLVIMVVHGMQRINSPKRVLCGNRTKTNCFVQSALRA